MSNGGDSPSNDDDSQRGLKRRPSVTKDESNDEEEAESKQKQRRTEPKSEDQETPPHKEEEVKVAASAASSPGGRGNEESRSVSSHQSKDSPPKALKEEDVPKETSPPTRRAVVRMVISNEDASFILGTGGRTKKKLARVSKTELLVSRDEETGETILEIKGSTESIERAKTYIGFVMQQRVGPVHLEDDVKQRDDIVILDIPHGCVGYVTGHKGQGLRSVEEEFSTLMFFTDVGGPRHSEEEAKDKVEKLVIFSPSERARQGAVLKVMSAIEQKIPGHFTKDIKPKLSESDTFATDVVKVAGDDYSYALGKGGQTRKKLARASGAVLEYIGEFAFIAGTPRQRERARKYLEWLCAQRVNQMDLTGIDERDDVISIDVPMDCVAFLTGHRGQALRHMEEQTGTFIFLGSSGDKTAETEKLYIFGETSNGRQRAKTLALQRIADKPGGSHHYSHRQSYGDRYDNRGGGDRDYRRPERDHHPRDTDRAPPRYGGPAASPSLSPPMRHRRPVSPPRNYKYRPESSYDDSSRRRSQPYYPDERRPYSRPSEVPGSGYSLSPPKGGSYRGTPSHSDGASRERYDYDHEYGRGSYGRGSQRRDPPSRGTQSSRQGNYYDSAPRYDDNRPPPSRPYEDGRQQPSSRYRY